MAVWRLADTTLDLNRSRPLGAGIVNVTVDSMWEGARSGTPEQAVEDGLRLVEAGFDLLDVGAVPAAAGEPVTVEEEMRRLIPAVEALAERAGVPVTADTFNPDVARAAAAAGAAAVNDIGGGRDEMLEAVAAAGCGYVLMHIEGPPRVERAAPEDPQILGRLERFFAERIERAVGLGVSEQSIAVDPGLDFDLTTDHAVEILSRLEQLRSLGRPLFVSLSRKDFIGALLAGSWERRLGPEDRLAGTIAAATIAAAAGAEIHRVHDPESLDAIRLAGAIAGA